MLTILVTFPIGNNSAEEWNQKNQLMGTVPLGTHTEPPGQGSTFIRDQQIISYLLKISDTFWKHILDDEGARSDFSLVKSTHPVHFSKRLDDKDGANPVIMDRLREQTR